MPPLLPLGPDELLSTTRAVRKRLDFDRPVEDHLIEECLEMATQAPTGSNAQGWHFVVVRDEAKRAGLGELYRKAFDVYEKMPMNAANLTTGDARNDATQQRVYNSARYLADNMAKAPVLVVPCIDGRVDNMPGFVTASFWGSLLPAAWSFCLAARARGLGTSWTTLHLMHEQEAADLLGIPFEKISQGALIPVAHVLGGTDFKPGPRRDLAPIVHHDTW